MPQIFYIAIAVLALVAAIFIYWRSHRLELSLQSREKEMNRRMYELAILKELGERVGYSLNVHNIVDVIMGSLHQFLEYSAVSYMLLEPEKIIFKVHLEKSVSRHFINDICERMLKSLSALLDKEFSKQEVEEVLSGAIIVEELVDPVNSYFNIPLVIDGKVVGVLTVAHTIAGLYKEEEMTILYKITQQASQAVTRLQEVVKTEQTKLNAMVETMSEGGVMVDKDYRLMVANPAAKKVIGLEGKKDITIFDFIDKLGATFDIRGKLEESIKLDKVIVIEEVLINDRFFQIFVSPVKASSGVIKGQVLGGVTIFRDITQEKQVERLRDDFTSMLVHELRSPLVGIKSMAEVIHMQEGNIEMIKEGIPMIYENSSRMLELVNDLLDSAKLEAGKFEIHKENVNLKELIQERIFFYKPIAEKSHIKLEPQYDPSLPSMVYCDPQRIGQVLNNLLSNALKFTSAKGNIRVQAFLHKHQMNVRDEAEKIGIHWFLDKNVKNISELEDCVIVAITDTGIGIAEKNISQLFNKFKQFVATSKKAEHKGTGLGLAISKGIIESHTGIIGVESREGLGSTFYFSLPIVL